MPDIINSLNPFAESIMRWGPAGIAAVLMLFAERRLKDRWQNAPPNAGSSIKWLYIGNWIFIAAMLCIVTYFWVYREASSTDGITSKGFIANVPDKVGLYSREKLFQRLTTKGNPFSATNEIEWHFLNGTPADKRLFTIQAPDGTTSREYFLSSELDYADPNNIELVYRKHSQEVFRLQYRAVGNLFKTLKPIPAAVSEGLSAAQTPAPQRIFGLLLSNAHAADVTFDMISTTLDSSNPIKRQDAAQYLTDHQASYSKAIDASLASGTLTENQLWGILYALGNPTKADGASSLSPAAQQAIFDAMFHQSETIRKRAQKIFISNLSSDSLQAYNRKCPDLSAMTDTALQARCAYLGMTIYYHLGITSVIGRDAVPTQTIIDAIKVMEPGRGLAQYDLPNQQIHHGKILYGLGLLYEKLAEAYEQGNLADSAVKARNNARIYFQQFLTFLQQHPSETEIYAYCWHVQQAECYLETPGKACIDKNPVTDCDVVELLTQATVNAAAQTESEAQAAESAVEAAAPPPATQ